MNTDIKHAYQENKYYTCKRLALLKFLRARGFIPYETVPELANPKFLNWRFYNTPKLQEAVTEYFAQFK